MERRSGRRWRAIKSAAKAQRRLINGGKAALTECVALDDAGVRSSARHSSSKARCMMAARDDASLRTALASAQAHSEATAEACRKAAAIERLNAQRVVTRRFWTAGTRLGAQRGGGTEASRKGPGN